ncbi:MAG: NAD(P)/FAD-dependent oxidoreductase [bacterium]|nr:NAD(P)/FAD-dependent oxidoreductase [bacterium]
MFFNNNDADTKDFVQQLKEWIKSPEAPPYLGEKNLAGDKYKKPEKLLENPDAIVIGSGIGGMGIASLLARRKKMKVLLLESSEIPGGCTRCHELGGFEWNSGLDSVGDLLPERGGRGVLRPTLDYMTGGKLHWAEMPEVHEVAYFGDDRYEWYAHPGKNIEWINKQFPSDEKKSGIEKYYKLEKKVETASTGWALTLMMPDWVPVFFRNFLYKIIGRTWRKYLFKSTTEVITKELGFPDKLASAFSYMYGNLGKTPAHAPFTLYSIYLNHYAHGAYYPIGGPGQIAECMIPVIEKAGGQLAVKTPAKKILVENNRAVGVELEDGQQIRSKLIISDASAYITFMELLDREVSEKHGYPEKFKQVKPGTAHLYLFLGYNEAIDLPEEIIWNLTSYDIETKDKQYKEDMNFEAGCSYILCPSARDSAYSERYPNKSTVIVLAEAPYKWVEQCRDDPKFKKKFEKDLANNLEKIVKKRIPALKNKKAAFRQAGVPIGCNPRAWEASSYGIGLDMERFTRDTTWLRPKTKIKGLYLTGQDAFSPGISGASIGARLCYAIIFKNWFIMVKKKIGDKIL